MDSKPAQICVARPYLLMEPELPAEAPKTAERADADFDLGNWLGMRRAFGMMAGRASAADAECLRRIRDDKLYLAKAAKWEDFCTQYLGTGRSQVNRIIHYLEEFGPEFFHLTQLTRISPDAYRAIAAQVKPEGLEFDGEVIPLLPQNVQRVSEAVTELRKRVEARKNPTRPAGDAFEAIERRLEDVIARVEALPPLLTAEQKISLSANLVELQKAAAKLGVMFLLA
ncbi:MAG TPA: hypothetical protein VLY24_22055 [Bryobacteraceae bacterium]|nr:hypothetical protein [Bryobacteraceae bacterium]